MKRNFNEAVIKTKEFINENEFDSSSIRVKTNLLKTISFIKSMYQFDKLLSITIHEYKLNYLLYSSDNEEEIKIISSISEKNQSLASFFSNATDLELAINREYGIEFVN